MMTRRLNGLLCSLCAILWLCMPGGPGSIALAQDITGGAGEAVKRPESSARRRPRTSQPKGSKRAAVAASSSATSQPKVDVSKQVDAALALGKAARESNPPRFPDAELAYRRVLEFDPKDGRAYKGLGHTFFDQKRYVEAEAAFRRASEVNPEDADAFVALAYTHNALERYVEAERSAMSALALDQNDYAANVALGWSKYRRKDYQGAESAYRRAIVLSPKNSQLYSELGGILMEQGRWRDSELLLAQAVALDPADAAILAEHGVVLHKLGQLDRAADAYAQASKLDAKMSAPHSNLALIQYTRGDLVNARKEWEAAIQLNSIYPLDRIGLLVLDRKLTEALSQLDEYTRANATDEDGWLLLGDVRHLQGDVEGSRAAYSKAAQIAPDYARHQRPTPPAPITAAPSPASAAASETTKGKSSSDPASDIAKQPEKSGKPESSGESTSKGTGLRYASSVRTVKATNFARATPASGALSITCTPNATVLIEPVAGGEALSTTVPSSVNVVAFSLLRPGDYRVVAALEGHETVETRVFVAVTRVVTIKLSLRPKP